MVIHMSSMAAERRFYGYWDIVPDLMSSGTSIYRVNIIHYNIYSKRQRQMITHEYLVKQIRKGIKRQKSDEKRLNGSLKISGSIRHSHIFLWKGKCQELCENSM